MPVEKANTIVERRLNELHADVERASGSDVLTLVGPILYGTEDAIREKVESVDARNDRLMVILETTGGYIEVVERIANTFRQHYKHVEFLVPNFALSAGTVLVMSGDAILMDYFSVLGPIDPQIRKPGGDGSMIPALGYLLKYEEFIKKSKKGQLTTAEMAILLGKFDLGELYRFEQARNLSISLLKTWLCQYKFRNWKRTEKRKRVVTQPMRAKRATEIATLLNDTNRWYSHGRGIPMQILREELNLKIDDFSERADLNNSVRAYRSLLIDYLGKTGNDAAIHVRGSLGFFQEN